MVYSDADWVGNIEDHKSISGGCFVGNNLVFSIVGNKSLSLSTIKAKYIVADSGCTQLL